VTPNTPSPEQEVAGRRGPRSAWRVIAADEVRRLRDELALAAVPPNWDQLAGGLTAEAYVNQIKATVSAHLDLAEEAINRRGRLRRVFDWYSGAALEGAWLNIHRASESLLMIQSPASMLGEFSQADATFRANIEASDPRYANLAHFLAEVSTVLVSNQQPEQLTAVLRAKLMAVRGVANRASDTAHETVRHWRNLLFIGGVVLAALALIIAIVHAIAPDFFSLAPNGIHPPGTIIQPWQVIVVGSFGGALAAVLALNRFSGFTDPTSLPIVQALLRIPTAAATSLIGVLLMQTATLGVLNPQKNAAVLAYAFFFGYAQEPLLRALDRRAGEVLEPARNKDEPAKTIPPAVAPTTPPPGPGPTTS
jgi:hypothetical protein